MITSARMTNRETRENSDASWQPLAARGGIQALGTCQVRNLLHEITMNSVYVNVLTGHAPTAKWETLVEFLMLLVCRRQVLNEKRPSSFDTAGCARIDKPSQRTCLPRGSVSETAHLNFRAFVSSFLSACMCFLSQFCACLSCASGLKKQTAPYSSRISDA